MAVSSHQQLRVVGEAPERYHVRVQSSDYAVPADGRLVFDIKMIHHGCDVYLFDRIPIRRRSDPAKEKVISIISGGTPVRRLSVQELSKLPPDSDGYHQFSVAQDRPAERH